jgi:hypothetical protein
MNTDLVWGILFVESLFTVQYMAFIVPSLDVEGAYCFVYSWFSSSGIP